MKNKKSDKTPEKSPGKSEKSGQLVLEYHKDSSKLAKLRRTCRRKFFRNDDLNYEDPALHHLNDVGVTIEEALMSKNISMPNLPKPLSIEEKKYMLAVERGDLANVRRMLHRAHRKKNMNVDCVDPLGRGALTLAIDSENLEMVELLVVMGVQTKDSLLQAIDVGFVEAVELLLEHEELVHKEGEPYSWEKVDWITATYTPDITPLILAAHRNNYEILKILLDRGATLPMPHEIRCGCDACIKESAEDSIRHSRSRINEYKALASPALIALSASDPILAAFELSWDLRNLAFTEQESKEEYLTLRRQCQQFAVDLLSQTRSSTELAIILNHDPESPPYEDGEHMQLARLQLAITYKQKKFVAHPNIQQLLATMWYDGLPGFKRKSLGAKLVDVCQVALLFPFYCFLYLIAPNTQTGKLMRKPFMKFLIHASSYLFFLLLLILVSQRVEDYVVELFGSNTMRDEMEREELIHRGHGPKVLEVLVGIYVLGFIWEETVEMWTEGIRKYLRNMWNFIDFTRNSLYIGVFILRVAAYVQQVREISMNPNTAYIPRELWDPFDPQLIAEGLFAAANVFSALKLVHLFSINPHLGPLQISLGRMVIDIIKFFFIYSLVLFAFACGLNQLLWYFAELERKKCYSLPGGLPDWDNKEDSCSKWRNFGNLFESTQSLFWASFGGVGTDAFQLTGIKTYTRFWGLLMFGSYSVINVIVLLNLLIAMMSNSYAMIDLHSDTEWKFARTKLWLSYFEESATLPPPFNIIPTPKLFLKLLGIRKKDKLRRMSTKEKERDYRYTAVMRALVWRYISTSQRHADDSMVTEDDVNEIKTEISAMKCEILNVLNKNGMDVSSADVKEKTVLGKKMKDWERQLMKDFHVAPVAAEEEMDLILREPPPDEDVLSKFRRIAKLAVLSSAQQKWGQVIKGACKASQIGHCNSREAYRNQKCLQKAMEEAQKLVCKSPKSEVRCPSPANFSLPDTTGSSIMELLQDITKESQELSPDLRIQRKQSLLDVQTKSVITGFSRGKSPSPQPPSRITAVNTTKPTTKVGAGVNNTQNINIPMLSISPPSSPRFLESGNPIKCTTDQGTTTGSAVMLESSKAGPGIPESSIGHEPSLKSQANVSTGGILYETSEPKTLVREMKKEGGGGIPAATAPVIPPRRNSGQGGVKGSEDNDLIQASNEAKNPKPPESGVPEFYSGSNIGSGSPRKSFDKYSGIRTLKSPEKTSKSYGKKSPETTPRRKPGRALGTRTGKMGNTPPSSPRPRRKSPELIPQEYGRSEDEHSLPHLSSPTTSAGSNSSKEALIPPSPTEQISTPTHLKGQVKLTNRKPRDGWI